MAAQPLAAVDDFYAAGVYQCRLTRAGTLRLTLAPEGRRLTVVVPAAVPGQPSTACSLAGAVVDLDTNDERGWWAPCLRLGWLATPKSTVYTRVRITTAVSKHYKSKKIGKTTYYVFRKKKDPIFTTTKTAAPGRPQCCALEYYCRGKWRSNGSQYFKLTSKASPRSR